MEEMMKKIVTVLLVTHEQARKGCARGSRALRTALCLAALPCATLAAETETLASGLTGSGTYDWTPSGSGLFTLTHTTTTSSGDVVLTATFMTPPKYVAPVYVDGIASNGIAYWTTNAVRAATRLSKVRRRA